MTTIEDLPDEVLKQILHNIPSDERKSSRKNLLFVSRRFNALADRTIGLEIFIGEAPWSGWEATAGSNRVELCKIQETGVAICHVGEVLSGALSQENPGLLGALKLFWGKVKSLFVSDQKPTFKYPHLLNTLRFSGIIRNEYFEALLNPATAFYLRKLQLNHSALTLLDSSSFSDLEFSSLEFLEISADFSYLFRDVDDSKISSNILALLEDSFPNLVSVMMYIPFEPHMEVRISRTLFRFFARSATKLKFLELIYFGMLNEDSDEDFDEDEAAHLNDQELELWAGRASQALRRVQAVVLHLNIDRLRCISYWAQLLSQQSQLEYFVILSEHQILTPEFIRNNSQTLRIIFACIDTRGSDGRPTPLDCQVFSECQQLSHLSIKGRFDNFVLLNATPGLINVEGLISSTLLVHIDISRIPVRSTDLHHILLGLPALEHFVGKYLGQHGEMGVTLETLSQILLRRQLRWFLLMSSIRGEFPDEGVTNGHPSRPILLYEEDDTFCVKVGKSGYYIMGSPFEELQTALSLRAGIRNQAQQQ